MTIFIAADHRGFELKNNLIEYIQEKDIRVEDLGNFQYDEGDDFPDFAKKVAQAVLQNLDDFLGIVICGSGAGVGIVCNRYKGIRCGSGVNIDEVKHIRERDHINILALGSDYVSFDEAAKMVDTFLTTSPLEDKKYLRRIKKTDEL